MHRLPQQELHNDEEQENDPRQDRAEEILPLLQETDKAQRNEIGTREFFVFPPIFSLKHERGYIH
jgi:hypothetical protein